MPLRKERKNEKDLQAVLEHDVFLVQKSPSLIALAQPEAAHAGHHPTCRAQVSLERKLSVIQASPVQSKNEKEISVSIKHEALSLSRSYPVEPFEFMWL
jgi:hypothetical protein